jgi:SAM-dependent methyltransferase
LVDLLPLREGDVVLDVGCGTGLCFLFLQNKIGASGAIIGIDESPQMLRVAARHVRDKGWQNVTLVEGSVERAEIPVSADAALFSAVHDVLQSREALYNVLSHLRPGGWVAAGGGKWTAPWLIPLNVFAFVMHEPYVRDFNGFGAPWRLLEQFVDELSVSEVAFGTGYLAVGRVKATIRGPGRK